MSRLTRLTKKEVPPEVAELFEQIGKTRGNVPNMFRVYAHRPKILETMMAHLEAVTRTGTVPTRTKELVAVLVSRINQCHYWNASHTAQAVRLGASSEQLDRIVDFENAALDEKEKAALAYSWQLTLNAREVSDELFARLRAQYDEGEIVEISAMAGLFNYFNRVNDALQMQPTKPGEGL